MTNPIPRPTQFITEKEVATIVRKKLKSGASLRAAVAFWGSGASEKLEITQATAPGKVTVICNLRMGGTNPVEIEKVRKTGSKVRHLDELHSKVYIFDDSLIVGSSNASANGLAFQDGDKMSWREANIFTSDETVLADARSWFDEIWRKASKITKGDLAAAKDAWGRKRSRGISLSGKNLFEVIRSNPHALDGRQFFVSIGSVVASDEATKAIEEYRADFPGEHKIDFYENWDEIPKDAVVIDFFQDERGRISFNGMYQTPLATISIPLKNKKGSIQICYKIEKIDNSPHAGLPLGSKPKWYNAIRRAQADLGDRVYEKEIPLSVFAQKYIE